MIHVYIIDKILFVGFFMEVTSSFNRITNARKDIAQFQKIQKLPNVIYCACNIIPCFQMYRLITLSFQIEAPGAS